MAAGYAAQNCVQINVATIISIEKLFTKTRPTVSSDDDCTVSIFCDFDFRNLSDGLADEGTAASILVLLTVLIQNTGMATIIHLIRVRHTRGMCPLGVLGACFLMVRFTIVILVLHLLQILM